MIVNPYESPQLEHAQQPAEPLPGDDGRLGPQHGLLYLFGVAIAAAIDPTIREAIQNRYFPWEWWPILITVALGGVGIASILWWAWQRLRRSTTFPRSFGHWLLLIQGASFLADCLYLYFYDRLIPRLPADEAVEVSHAVNFQIRVIYALLWSAVAAVEVLALRYSRQQTLWVRYAAIIIATTLLSVMFHLVSWERSVLASTIATALSFLALLCLFLAAARDFQHSQRLDQLHWAGVTCQLTMIFWARFTQSYWAVISQT